MSLSHVNAIYWTQMVYNPLRLCLAYGQNQISLVVINEINFQQKMVVWFSRFGFLKIVTLASCSFGWLAVVFSKVTGYTWLVRNSVNRWHIWLKILNSLLKTLLSEKFTFVRHYRIISSSYVFLFPLSGITKIWWGRRITLVSKIGHTNFNGSQLRSNELFCQKRLQLSYKYFDIQDFEIFSTQVSLRRKKSKLSDTYRKSCLLNNSTENTNLITDRHWQTQNQSSPSHPSGRIT